MMCVYMHEKITSLHFYHLYQIFNENKFVGDLRAQASDIQETLDTYDTPRSVKTIADQDIFDCQ